MTIDISNIPVGLCIIAVTLTFTIINLIVALILGIRKKDLLTVFVSNIIVKTIISAIIIPILAANSSAIWSVVLAFPIVALAEGIIYKKRFKDYTKHNGMDVAFVCNFAWVLLALAIAPVLLIIVAIL